MAKPFESGDGRDAEFWASLLGEADEFENAQCRNNQHVCAGMMEYDVIMRLKLYLCVYKHYIGARV